MGESSAVHDFIQELLIRGYGGRQNFTVAHGPIIGKADYISPSGTVIEIKALKQMPKKIPKEYVKQLKATIYAASGRTAQGVVIGVAADGILLVIDKSKAFNPKHWSQIKQPIKAIDVTLTEEDIKQIEERGNEILKAVNDGIMPDMEGESPHSEMCQWCSFHHVCYKMGETKWAKNQTE